MCIDHVFRCEGGGRDDHFLFILQPCKSCVGTESSCPQRPKKWTTGVCTLCQITASNEDGSGLSHLLKEQNESPASFGQIGNKGLTKGIQSQEFQPTKRRHKENSQFEDAQSSLVPLKRRRLAERTRQESSSPFILPAIDPLQQSRPNQFQSGFFQSSLGLDCHPPVENEQTSEFQSLGLCADPADLHLLQYPGQWSQQGSQIQSPHWGLLQEHITRPGNTEKPKETLEGPRMSEVEKEKMMEDMIQQYRQDFGSWPGPELTGGYGLNTQSREAECATPFVPIQQHEEAYSTHRETGSFQPEIQPPPAQHPMSTKRANSFQAQNTHSRDESSFQHQDISLSDHSIQSPQEWAPSPFFSLDFCNRELLKQLLREFHEEHFTSTDERRRLIQRYQPYLAGDRRDWYIKQDAVAKQLGANSQFMSEFGALRRQAKAHAVRNENRSEDKRGQESGDAEGKEMTH